VWVVGTLAVTAGFGRLAAHNLANYRPLSNDEGELMAVGYKLASEGILGSNMYVGFFGADQHDLENLPLQHVLQAIAFQMFGAGVTQARLVSLLAAVTLIWVVGWLAFRWYGLATSLLAELLLVAWRSNLTAASDGLPLLGVARTARYDVLAVTAVWLAIAALDTCLRRPGAIPALLTGVGAGVAALAQFFGIFVLAVVLMGWSLNRPQARLGQVGWWIVAGFVIAVAPWTLYVAGNASDFAGQLTVYGSRGAFFTPGFVLNNFITEPLRYSDLVTQWPPVLDISGPDLSYHPVSPWLVVLGIWPALAYVGWRARKRYAVGDRLLMCSLVSFGGLLCLLDQTKTPLYSILLLPSVSICLAAAGVAVMTWSGHGTGRLWIRAVGLFAVVAMCTIIALESVHAYAVDWVEASSVTPYLALGEQIDVAIGPEAAVLGPERWWWALHEHPYVSLRNIWFQWAVLAHAGATPEFADWVVRTHPDTLIVNINVRADVQAFPQALQDQFWSFVERCTVRTADFPNANYFDTTVYTVNQGCR
jgi:4-amino-4-deoxy-L-arabinose transferase-like glycosyltransferase